jgi:di/tricarboxylate transporter
MTALHITLLTLLAASALFLSDRMRPDLIALLAAITLGLTGVLTVQEVFSGFSRSAVITIMSIFILAEGLRRTGVTDQAGQALLRLTGSREGRMSSVVLMAGATLSLFMNNIAAASVLLPAVSGAARKARVSLPRLLMPLAFGTILGGMATLLTTTNIVASSLLRDSDLAGFGLLDFAPVGIPLVLAGALYMAIWGRRMLPEKTPAQRLQEFPSAEQNLLQIYRLDERVLRGRVRPGSELVGIPLGSSCLRESFKLNVIGIERAGKRIFPLTPDLVLHAGDIILLMGKPEDYSPTNLEAQFEMLQASGWQQEYFATGNVQLIEAVLAPRSTLVDQTLSQAQFREKYGVNVLAIWRGERPIRTALSDLPLHFGDALLMEGTANSLDLLKSEVGLLILTHTKETSHPLSRKAWLATSILAATLLLAAIFPDRVGEFMLGGALAMILAGMLSMDQAYAAIEWRSVFLVAGMLPMGIAMTKTGAAALLSEYILRLLGERGPLALLAVLVILGTLLTQVMSGAAVAAILIPVAIGAAQSTGNDPRAMAMGVALATSMAFITPLGHPVNILVMSQGGYRFRDFVRVGLPLTILLIILVLTLLPVFWPLTLP